MYSNIPYEQARDIMLAQVRPSETENVPLAQCYGRVLAKDLIASADVPPFDRSPYDGYAIRTADTIDASRESPVTLSITEEIPAGSVPTIPVTAGTAAKILTGSPVPAGADCVVKYEETEFTAEVVKIFGHITSHDIILRGEDVKKGALLAKRGDLIDSALAGTLAAQGVSSPVVFRKPKIGIISTGNEIVDPEEEISGGKIRNTNRYMLEGAILRAGAEPVILGTARDDAGEIAALVEKGIAVCDMIVSTGGASVGDYDTMPAVLEISGAQTLVRKIDMKPGGACVYGVRDGKIIFGLSGNPAAAAVNFYSVCLPCVRKLMGLSGFMLSETVVTLAEDFEKKSKQTRLIRGRLDLSDGEIMLRFSGQGNAMLHAMVGCDVLAEIPENSPPMRAGARLRAYLI